MSNDPIKTLTDTLTLLRVEIADVKKRQIRGLMPEGAESYAKPFSATCIRQ